MSMMTCTCSCTALATFLMILSRSGRWPLAVVLTLGLSVVLAAWTLECSCCVSRNLARHSMIVKLVESLPFNCFFCVGENTAMPSPNSRSFVISIRATVTFFSFA